MKTRLVLAVCIFLATVFPSRVHLLVPPKTPILSGFEPAAIGSYRELVCDAMQPGTGTISYKWYKYSIDHNGVENWERKGPIGTGQKYVFNPVTEKKVFPMATPEQPVSGKYKCRASNSAGTRNSEWGDLYVYAPCSLYTVSVSPAIPGIGSTFTLKCYIPNPSGLSVTWIKKADALSRSHEVAYANIRGCHQPIYPRYSWSGCSPPSISSPTKTFNLQVTNAQISDSAYWICKDIGLSCNSNPVKTIVQGPPGTPTITGFPSGPVTAGTQVNLLCVAAPSGDSYDWYKDGTKVTTSLSYDFPVRKESAGVYNCSARNSAGSATSSDMTLQVYYKADSVMVYSGKTSSHVGEKDKFTCTVTGGYPTPTLKLYFKRSSGTPVEVAQGQDRAMAKEDNQAEYYCKAKVTGYPALDMTSSRKTYNVTYPPTVSMSSNPMPVEEGDTLTLTCSATGGNPTYYTYKWFYMNKEIPNEISKDYRITRIKFTQSGTYRCQAINYLPNGKTDASLDIDIQYKGKWKPDLPKVFAAVSQANAPMKFVLHVIANPIPTKVTWFFSNMTTVMTVGGAFMASKVNDTTYTLSKKSVEVKDYGNYTVNVTNAVGISTFTFELHRAGPPLTPCCLGLDSATAVSLTLSFMSNFSGGSDQTFIIEKRVFGQNVWDLAARSFADPGTGNKVTQKISDLGSEAYYVFRVKARNPYGDSDYGELLEAKTEDSDRRPTEDDAAGLTSTPQTCKSVQDPVYMNVNRAFEGDADAPNQKESVYVNCPRNTPMRADGAGFAVPEDDESRKDRPGDRQERSEDISVEDFQKWLLSKQVIVTESSHQVLAKSGLNNIAIFALLEQEDLKALRIKPLRQEVLVRNLVESFRSGAERLRGDEQGSRPGDEKEAENPYEELNITPDVVGDQVYAKLKPWTSSRADC